MSNLKLGDLVVYTNRGIKSSPAPLVANRLYRVDSITPGLVKLEGIFGFWREERFEKVSDGPLTAPTIKFTNCKVEGFPHDFASGTKCTRCGALSNLPVPGSKLGPCNHERSGPKNHDRKVVPLPTPPNYDVHSAIARLPRTQSGPPTYEGDLAIRRNRGQED